MCTQTNIENENGNNTEPSQGIENFPRDINVLLGLDSYQGMTDEEINLVLDYKTRQAKVSQEILALEAAQIVKTNETIALQEQAGQDVVNVIQSLRAQIEQQIAYHPATQLDFTGTEIAPMIAAYVPTIRQVQPTQVTEQSLRTVTPGEIHYDSIGV